MAKVKKSADTKIETPSVEEVATVEEASETAAVDSEKSDIDFGAITNLADLEIAYKAMRKDLRKKDSSDNKALAIDLVTDAADGLVDAMLAAVDERGMKFSNFTVRYNSKNDSGKGVGDQRGISTVTGVVKMTQDEIKARDEFNDAEYGELVDALADANNSDSATAVLEVLEDTRVWIADHPSFTIPVVEEDETVENAETEA